MGTVARQLLLLTHLLMRFGLSFFTAMTMMTMMSTTSRAMMMTPKRKPKISPTLTCSATTGLTLGPFSSVLGVVVFIVTVAFDVVGIAFVVVVTVSTTSKQSGSARVSREALQLLSRCRRVERTVMEAEPVATHD